MTDQPSKPDVEALIAEIQQDVAQAEAGAKTVQAAPEPVLEDELRTANQCAAVGQGGGPVAKIMRKLLGSLVDDINRFQAASVRSLNLLAQRVQAVSGEGQAELMETARRTEAKQVELDQRIHALEETLKDRNPPS